MLGLSVDRKYRGIDEQIKSNYWNYLFVDMKVS